MRERKTTVPQVFRGYVDNRTLEIRLVKDLLGNSLQESWRVVLVHTELDDDFESRLIDQLTETLGTAPFTIEQRRSYMSWGASGGTSHIVLDAAAWAVGTALTAAAGDATYHALKAVVTKTVRTACDRAEWPAEPIHREEAIERARWHITERFKLQPENEDPSSPHLELVGEEERVGGSRLVRFVHRDRTYEVEVLDDAGLVLIGRVGWTSME